jgi:hypothetical protein
MWKSHSAGRNCTLLVEITLVRVEITRCVWTLDFACRNHTMRKEIKLFRVEITLFRLEITLFRVEITLFRVKNTLFRVEITISRVNITCNQNLTSSSPPNTI